jgi:hypothetical protein
MINQQEESDSMADQAAYDAASRALLAKTGKDLDAWVAGRGGALAARRL